MKHFLISCGCTYSKRAYRLLSGSGRMMVSLFSQKHFFSFRENSTFFGIYGFAITCPHISINNGNLSVLRRRCKIRRKDFQSVHLDLRGERGKARCGNV